jgi:hypothetical protein
MTSLFTVIWLHLRTRVALVREQDSDAGYSTETVVVTAILVALALLVVGTIIYNKVVGKANGINL